MFKNKDHRSIKLQALLVRLCEVYHPEATIEIENKEYSLTEVKQFLLEVPIG